MNPLDDILKFLIQTDELGTAKQLLKTFQKYSNGIDQYDQLGRLFHDIKAYPEAIKCVEATMALAASPEQLYATRSNLIKLLNHTNKPQQALTYINANLSINPHDYDAKMEKVFALYLSGDLASSQALTEQLLNDPATPTNIKERCQFNYGSYQMDMGDFKAGIINFIDVGHRIGIWPQVKLPGDIWDGTVVPNAVIAIQAEGGIGDEVINVRFMKHISDLGMTPIWITNRDDLAILFNRNGFKTVRSKSEIPNDALWIQSMYLPIVLGLDKDQLWSGPYLTPDPKYVKKWEHIKEGLKKKVAIRWSGNPAYEQDLHRSMSLKILNTYLDMDYAPYINIDFYSVQKENFDGIEDYRHVHNLGPELDTLEDLLAVLSLMDTTITSCTSVAHIAGAAGLSFTVCPPIATYYTWLGDAKWYGENCTILRQTKHNDWSHLQSIIL